MFEIRKDDFYLDNQPIKIYSGAIHYFRVVPEYWEDRLLKLKAAGFNTVETYMCWNLHEPKEGEFCFDGMLDIAKFISIAAKLGLYVIVRPGPYICAEWDFGGLPAWLLEDKNLRIRCNNEKYMEKVENYLKKVFSILAPLQVSNGGNILMIQVENEYGSYGNDKNYLNNIKKIILDSKINVPLFTADGNSNDMLSGGSLPDVYMALNFGSNPMYAFSLAEKWQPNMPKTCMEFWCGWFDHWGESHHKRNPTIVASEIRKIVESGGNLNVYMFHGGTNFNFWAGANSFSKYMPTVTSYDDAALLNEYGDYTPAYHKVREVLYKKRGLSLSDPLPNSPQLQNIGSIQLSQRGDYFDNIYKLGVKHNSPAPESMEYYGQNFGQILYRKVVKGKYGSHMLYIEGVHDIAYVRVNGKLVKKYDRTKNGKRKNNDGFKVRVPSFDKELLIEILVEGMGRTNYGPDMETDRKGIQKVRLDYQTLFDWEVYTVPFDNIEKAVFENNVEVSKPSFLKGNFDAQLNKDCFIDMKGFKKGFVVINGFNIGRYWSRGPQRTLYIPAPLLKEKDNEVIIVEQEGYKVPVVNIIDKHYL